MMNSCDRRFMALALEQAEELYIDTSAYSAAEHENVIVLQREGEQR